MLMIKNYHDVNSRNNAHGCEAIGHIANYVTNSQMVYFIDYIFLGCLMVFLDSTNLKIFTMKYFLYN